MRLAGITPLALRIAGARRGGAVLRVGLWVGEAIAIVPSAIASVVLLIGTPVFFSIGRVNL